MILTPEQVKTLWKMGENRRKIYLRNKSYYEGTHVPSALLEPRMDGRVRTQVKSSWVETIIGTHSGVMLSNPVQYVMNDQEADQTPVVNLRKILELANATAIDVVHVLNCLLYGRSAEVHGFDGKNIVITQMDPISFVEVRDEDDVLKAFIYSEVLPKGTFLNGKLLEKSVLRFHVWDAETYTILIEVDTNNGKELRVQTTMAHAYGRVPVVIFTINKDGRPFISESLLSQIDSWIITKSALTDNIRSGTDSILVTEGIDFTQLLQKDENTGKTILAKMQEIGVLPLPPGAKAEYITRQIDTAQFEQDLSTTVASILIEGSIPNMAQIANFDKGILNLSGTALRLLFAPTVARAKEHSRYLNKGFKDRVNLINIVQKALGQPVLQQDVYKVVWTFAIPSDDLAWAAQIPQLKQCMANKDVLRTLPFITSPEHAQENFEREQDEEAAGAVSTNTP